MLPWGQPIASVFGLHVGGSRQCTKGCAKLLRILPPRPRDAAPLPATPEVGVVPGTCRAGRRLSIDGCPVAATEFLASTRRGDDTAASWRVCCRAVSSHMGGRYTCEPRCAHCLSTHTKSVGTRVFDTNGVSAAFIASGVKLKKLVDKRVQAATCSSWIQLAG
jgi:hypothetical protein